MFIKALLKNPIFILGLLLLFIAYSDMNRRGIFKSRNESLTATSCRSALVMLDKRVAANWNNFCEGNNLAIEIESELKVQDFKTPNEFKAALYRELANNLIFVARNTLNESLERTLFVRLRLKTDSLEINALSEGKNAAKFKTLKNPQIIAEHFKHTVSVQEKKR